MSTLNPSAIEIQAEPRVLSARAFEPEFYNISLMPGQTPTDTGETSSQENCVHFNGREIGGKRCAQLNALTAIGVNDLTQFHESPRQHQSQTSGNMLHRSEAHPLVDGAAWVLNNCRHLA